MITIKKEIIIESNPENIFNFLIHIDTLYKVWHPKDHIFCKTLYKRFNSAGCIFHFFEIISGIPIYLVVKVSKVKANQYIEYIPLFPLSLFNLGRGYFALEGISENKSKLISYIEYGDIFGLIDNISRIFIKTDVIEKHIQEESQNIKRYLENPSKL